MKILVTGSKGQLGLSIKKISNEYPNHNFIFTDVAELDITNYGEVNAFFNKYQPDFCINAAAYTNVDKAEEETEFNTSINQIGPRNLAKICSNYNTTLIHISSDYVYNSDSNEIMDETHLTKPTGAYAKSKLAGENEVLKHLNKCFIIRTSWLYSEFGKNFVKTIIHYGKERDQLKVVNDQIGSPTYATDLAKVIMIFIKNNNIDYGIYNYSNLGNISWYEFASEIINLSNINCKIISIPSIDYPTLAPRPKNSKISKNKILSSLKISIPNWQESLKECINLLNNN